MQLPSRPLLPLADAVPTSQHRFPSTSSDGPTTERVGEAALPLSRLDDLLAFRAPYLTKKLLRLKIVRSTEEASALLDEVKKYLVLCAVHRARPIPMFSRRVDEVWHQFVLFTSYYEEFARTYFGVFVHHDPAEAEEEQDVADAAGAAARMTFDEFRAAYELLFGEFSELWFDDRAIDARTRLGRAEKRAPFGVRVVDARAELVMQTEPPLVVCRVDVRAAPALAFLSSIDLFFVRELPALRNDAERIALCRELTKIGVLYVAP